VGSKANRCGDKDPKVGLRLFTIGGGGNWGLVVKKGEGRLTGVINT